jgi:predicted neutral ceramidase superfamily lipid hydrolase
VTKDELLQLTLGGLARTQLRIGSVFIFLLLSYSAATPAITGGLVSSSVYSFSLLLVSSIVYSFSLPIVFSQDTVFSTTPSAAASPSSALEFSSSFHGRRIGGNPA